MRAGVPALTGGLAVQERAAACRFALSVRPRFISRSDRAVYVIVVVMIAPRE